MRILLAHNSTYYPAQGGGDVSNRLLMENLAARAHECMVVARGPSDLLTELAHRDVQATVEERGIVRFGLNAVEVHAATDALNLRDYFARSITAFEPDVILASTDDAAQVLLEAALESGRPVVYLARATIALPFGPDCAFPSDEKTATLRRVHAMAGVSRYVADYICQWGGIEAVSLPISFMGDGPFANVGRFDNEFTTLINPCIVKGIDIFIGLADAMPDVRFAAVPTWGTSAKDLATLRARSNITVVPAEDKIERILARTRVLLVPSVWAEARARVVLEAMLHGVPVIASNTGGLPEAKMGVPYVLPVRPIAAYRHSLDERMVPEAEAPAQDLEPWIAALHRLWTDRGHWEEIARDSQITAVRDVDERLRIEPFEQFLEQARVRRPSATVPRADLLDNDLRSARLRLLAIRLRQAQETNKSGPNIFWFPYAGSRAPFRGTRVVRYPERMESMDQVVADIVQELAPTLRDHFVFFGHSMGAGIAFEVTRALRRLGLPMPLALLVSGATAPQLRTTIAADPDSHSMPRFEEDSAFYRRYLYRAEAPLDLPIRVYSGSGDLSVNLSKWHEQTTGSFGMRSFPGGHLYLLESGEALRNAIDEDLSELLPR